jgi:hypothetical protein
VSGTPDEGVRWLAGQLREHLRAGYEDAREHLRAAESGAEAEYFRGRADALGDALDALHELTGELTGDGEW